MRPIIGVTRTVSRTAPLDRPAVDRDQLERMAMQMYRMRHHRAVYQIDLNALALT
jgi:hypothetical protein